MSQPISLTDIKEQFKSLKAEFDRGQEPVQLLTEIWSVLKSINEDPENTIYTNPELKKFFFEEYVGGLTKRIVSIKYTSNEQYLAIIHRISMALCFLFIQGIKMDNADLADAMRCFFDFNAPIHQNLFQLQERQFSNDDPGILEKLSEDDRLWRLSLKEGTKLDAVKINYEYSLKQWSKGVITSIIGNGKYFQVLFENDVNSASRDFTIYSTEIARYDTMSKGDEWRNELKKGDLIDAYDTTKVWYSSTILNKEVREFDSGPVQFLHIGFRIYHPDGNKVDMKMQKFFGWSDSFDEWLPAYSPRIQKYQHFAKVWDSSLQMSSQYDDACDDQADLLLYSPENNRSMIYAIERKKCRSNLLIQFLNLFGDLNGFQLILDKIRDDGSSSLQQDQQIENEREKVNGGGAASLGGIGLDLLFYYVDCIGGCAIMLNRAFFHQYVQDLFTVVRQKLLNANEMQLRNFKKDRLDQLINIIINNMKVRFLTSKQREQDKQFFSIEIGCLFLEQNFLEKRIDGAKLIHEVCKSINQILFNQCNETIMNNSTKTLQLQFISQLISKLRERNAIYQFFSKERAHFELIQRSEEFLKLLLSQNAFTQSDMEMLWSCIKKGEESIQLHMYKILVEISSKLKHNHIAFIIEELSSKSTATKEEIELVHEMARRTSQIELSTIAVDYLWKIAIDSHDKIDKALVNHAGMSFSDIIKYWTIDNKMHYIDKLIQNLNQNKEGFLSIKMLMKIFKDYINYGQQGSLDSLIEDLNKEEEQNEPPQLQADTNELEENANDGGSSLMSQSKVQNVSLIDYVNKKYDLLQIFFSNFKNYMDRAREVMQKKIEQNPLLEINTLADKCLADKFIHSDQIIERLEFLKFILGNTQAIKINIQQLKLLWEELGSGACLVQNDEELFYKWLRESVEYHNEGVSIIDMEILVQFFKEMLSKNSRQIQFITLEGFNCIQSMFILMNEQEKKLIRLGLHFSANSSGGSGQNKFTSYSNTQGPQHNNYSFNKMSKLNNQVQSSTDSEDVDINILVHPEQLEGIDNLWYIAINSNDLKVQNKATALLLKSYTNIAFRNEERISEFEDSFINRCIFGIKEQLSIINSRKEEPKEEFVKIEKQLTSFSIPTTTTVRVLPPEEKKIVRMIHLIKELIKNSEMEGTWGVKSHSSLFKGEYLHTIQVNNSIKNGNKYSSKIELGTYSNISLWELRKIIGQRAAMYQNQDGSIVQEQPVHPLHIRLYRFTGSLDLKENENGKTLADLRFKPNETLAAYKKNVYSAPRQPLLNEFQNDLSDRAKQIFKSWFYTFSIEDPDGSGKRIMTPTTCAAFARTCTEDHVTEEDGRVIGLFATYDKDRDSKLTEEDFLLFYKTCSMEKEDVVRQNLLQHNYRFDLRKQIRDEDDDHILQIRKGPAEMPRFKMSNYKDNFETIFKLLEKHGELANTAWSLIKTISTNQELYWKVLMLHKNKDFQWEQIFDSSSIYKMLYTLQIIESLLEEDPRQIDLQSELGLLKKDWIKRFLEQDGFQQILKLFQNSNKTLIGKPADNLNKFEKSLLEFMLKMIKIFMMAAFAQDQSNAFFDLQLAKKNSSYVEESNNQNKESSAISKQQENQRDDKENRVADEEQYKTPQKQFKPLVKYGAAPAGVEAKNLYNASFQPDVNEDFLFGAQQQNSNTNQQQLATSKETKGEDTTSRQQNEQQESDIENDMKRFSYLVNVMKETGLGEIILDKIDFRVLQEQVLEIVCLMLNKKDINIDDKLIIENALSLWVASIVRQQNLMDDFYVYKRSEEKAGKYGTKNADEFIINTLYCYKNFKIREEMANSIQILCSKVTKNQGQLPIFYFLNLLRNNFPKEELYYATRECKQYFELFCKIIDAYYSFGVDNEKYNENKGSIDMCELLRDVIEKMKRHETKEKKTSILEDKTLIGYMDLVKKLISYLNNQSDQSKLLQVFYETDLIHEMFYENLFYHPVLTKAVSQQKCKCKESRAAGFTLMQKIIESLGPKEMSTFLADYLAPFIKDVKKPKKWCYQPAQQNRMSSFVGIVNLGCICYMNSMLQQFFMVPSFRYQLLKAIDKSPEQIVEYKGMKIDDNLLRQLQKLFGYLELSERQAYDPTEFCFSFKDFEGNPTNTAIQNDAQEFLSIFFDRVEELLRPTSQKHLLEDIFGFKLCSQLICQSCGNVKSLLESQYTLSLQVKDRKGIEDSLHKQIEGTIINDYKCEACNQRVDILKRNLIAETPNVLIIHLQRIVFNFDTFQNDKINTRFEFPYILNLKEFSFKEVMKNEGKPDELMYTPELEHLMNIGDDEYTYKLVGVNIHVGTAEHGHYYSLINTKRGSEEVEETKLEWTQTDKDPWKQFDDEKISHYSFNELKVDSFGGTSNSNMNDHEMNAYLTNTGGSFGKNAYMLVYERKKKKLLTEIVTEDELLQQSNATLDCANSASFRVANQQLAEKQKQQQEMVLSIGDKKQIDFKKVQQYIPEWIRSTVIQDNASNLVDQHLFSDGFFNMVKSTLKHISDSLLLTQHRYSLEYTSIFNRIKTQSLSISRKMMFEVLAYAFYNNQMSDITSSTSSIIQFCDSHYTLKRGEESMLATFIKEQYLADNCQSFFNIMFNCTDKTSRFYIGRLTTSIINKAFQVVESYILNYGEEDLQEGGMGEERQSVVKDLQESAEKFVYLCIIALQTSECQKNWSRLEHYFKMIQEIGMGGKMQTHYLLTKFDIIVDLIDFMLGNRSPIAIQKGEKRPNMGAGMSNPPFENLVSLVSYLIRFSLTPEMKAEESSWNLTYNQLPSTLLGYVLKENDEEMLLANQQEKGASFEKYPLSEVAFNFFTYPDFIDKVLREGYNCEEFGKALAHFCYKNKIFSKRVAKLLLKGIAKNDMDKVKNYLDVVTQVALIHDEYQEIRLEWMFGIAMMNSSAQYIQAPTFNLELNSTKLGIQIVKSLQNDEIYSYKSQLLPHDSDDALLNLLWRYKGRIDQYTVSCLHSLINLLSLDDRVCAYFALLPGPTYCYARYTDWFKPYLHEQLLDARKGYHGSLSQQKEEQVIKVLSLLERYEKFLKEKDMVVGEEIISGATTNLFQYNQEESNSQQYQEDNKNMIMNDEGYQLVSSGENEDQAMQINEEEREEEENVKNLIQQDDKQNERFESKINQQNKEEIQTSIPCNPRPYIIIECLRAVNKIESDFDGIVLGTAQLSCLYSTSYPTGKGNLSIPDKLYKKSTFKMNVRQMYNGTNKREQEMQERSIGGQFDSKKIKDMATIAGETGTKIDTSDVQKVRDNSMKDEDKNANNEEGVPHDVIIDGNEQWGHEEYEEPFNFDNVQNERQNIVENNSTEQQYYNIQVVEKGEETDQVKEKQNDMEEGVGDVAQINTRDQTQDDQMQNVDAKKDQLDGGEIILEPIIEEEKIAMPSQLNWPFGINQCDDLVYKFYIINNRDQTVKCTLSLTPLDDQPDVNLYYPKGGVKIMVYPQTTKTLLLCPKIIPSQNEYMQNFGEDYGTGKTSFRFETNRLNISLIWKSKSYYDTRTMNRVAIYPQPPSDYGHDMQDFTKGRRPGILNTNSSIQPVHPEMFDDKKNKEKNDLESEKEKQDDGDAAGVGGSEKADKGSEPEMMASTDKKVCPQCTVYNSVENVFCEVCFYDFPA